MAGGWAKRTREWPRNLNHWLAVIRSEFRLEGERAPSAVVSEWKATRTSLRRTRPPIPTATRALTGRARSWQDALETCRPSLAGSELGSMLDEGRSKLYDALLTILGLDVLVDAPVLQKPRTARDGDVDAPA